MNAKVCLAAMAAGLLLAGCSTVTRIDPEPMAPARVEVQVKPTDYSVEILMLDVGKTARKLLFSHPDSNLETVLKDPETGLTRIPMLYVTPGATALLDTRKVYRYPVEFDGQGQPLKFNTRAVGLMVQVALAAEKSGALSVTVAGEDNRLLGFEPIKTPGKTTYERPLVEARKASGTTPVESGKWAVASSDAVAVERKDKPGSVPDQIWRVVLVKVLPPKAK